MSAKQKVGDSVWIRVGTTQHPATVVKIQSDQVLVEWASNSEKEWVALSCVDQLPQRRRKSPRKSENSEMETARSSYHTTTTDEAMPSTDNRKSDLPAKVTTQDNSEETSDDDEIEYLLTIDAPSSKCQDNSDHPSTTAQTEQSPTTVENIEPGFAESSVKNRDVKTSEPLVPVSKVVHDSPTAPANGERRTKFSLASSAYLQNLAEICHEILNDCRWRIKNKPLFQWEHGDDLSVSLALAKLYRPPPTFDSANFPCTCILCGKEDHAGLKSIDHPEPIESVDQKEIEDDMDSRALYLYCRLFYRKGPWFRVDDIFRRYYQPVKTPEKAQATIDGESIETKPPSSSAANDNYQSGKSSRAKVDDAILRAHYDSVRRMYEDIEYLSRNGFIRSSEDEEECGRFVANSILRSEERRFVLSKLGMGRVTSKSARHASRNGPKQPVVENEIWKQMSQQRSLFATKGQRHLLPVRRHVDEAIQSSLAKLILSGSTAGEGQLPRPLQREVLAGIQKAVSLIRAGVSEGLGALSCLRLREAPRLVLQRIARLYMCATLGPGQMRGDGTNGWKSLGENHGSFPLERTVPVPGQRSWHAVVYPGLGERFGLNPFFFQTRYVHVPDSDVRGTWMPVFASRGVFLAWEAAVELRAQTDYLSELTETLKYNQRRKAKGKGSYLPEDKQTASVDFLGLLKPGGMEKVHSTFEVALKTDFPKATELVSPDDVAAPFSFESEQILVYICVLVTNVLNNFYKEVSEEELRWRFERPWLRHLWWDACLAAILWDVVPFLEKAGLYSLAVQALSLLLFGTPVAPDDIYSTLPGLFSDRTARASRKTLFHPLSWAIVSRRTRSKMLDRMVIDLKHILQRESKDLPSKERSKAVARNRDTLSSFCGAIIVGTASSGGVAFSALRGFIRRLEAKERRVVLDLTFLEPVTLNFSGFRCEIKRDQVEEWENWVPVVDSAVAVSLQNDDSERGSRCSFIGHEDDYNDPTSRRSLNVEELAIEFYSSGRLPVETLSLKGGWHGFHDEGGNVRALFRILSAAPLLGSPFDLHVAHEQMENESVQSFYQRHERRIRSFLERLRSLDEQSLCDAVYDACSARVLFTSLAKRKDISLERDVARLRTLSFVAAACGGKLLADIFHCFFFDYRHYSGGLPDCLLVRGRLDGNTLVNLDEWVGEIFSTQSEVDQELAVSILADKDEEFLGCIKSSDGIGRQSRRNGAARAAVQSNMNPKLPDRLVLEFDGRVVQPECMMVEVKSANDRLDPRQEDWLRILGRHGDARVCKFVEREASSRKAKRPKNEG